MKNIRIGKDIRITMNVVKDGIHLPITDLDLSLELADPYGKKKELPFSSSGSVISATYHGIEQVHNGPYIISLWLNRNKVNQSVIDIVPAFKLVRWTTMEGGEADSSLEIVSLDLGVVDIGRDDIHDILFAKEKVSTLNDADEILIRQGNEIKKTTAAALRKYANYGIEVEFVNK